MKFNQLTADYTKHLCVHQLFEAQVGQTLDAVAVVFENQQLTYNELSARANQLAHYLQSKGVGQEVLVALFVERSIEMVIGMLAILKAGGAYVPIDPAYPQERVADILSDARVSVLLTQQKLVADLPSHGARTVCLDTDKQIIDQQSQQNPASPVTANCLAYVLYTSGSTGRPKGVTIAHCSTVSLLAWAKQVYSPQQLAGVLAATSICFDLSVFELFVPLSWGGKVILAENPLYLPTLLAANNVTLVNTVPSAVAELLRIDGIPDSVSTINLAGEPLHNKLVQQLYERKTVEQVFNLYGPSEDTTYSTFIQVEKLGKTNPPIGCPLGNKEIYLLDTYGYPVANGVAGELHIGGVGLARSYLNRPELTAQNFIPNPFSSQPGARLYKTGDLGRYLLDGNIEFLGRIDHQVKLRGYRIELGEIESVLNDHPQVQQAVAIVREDSPGNKRLVAYYTPYSSDSLNTNIESTPLPTEQVSQWQAIYDQTYAQSSEPSDSTFNIVGWRSSYTNQPIPSEQMRQWLNGRVSHLLAFQPQRVLELGCGTGLLLFQIAPYCKQYYGTDFSDVAIASLAKQLRHPEWHLPQVQLQQKLADDFADVADASFDTVILNSVAQHFPNIEYLLKVLEGAVKAVAPGGIIFVGDVRSLPLLEAFHTSVQLYQAREELSIERLRQRVHTEMTQEAELLIDPEFFLALKQHLPQINNVQIRLERGEYHNELTSFRYDVTLEVGSGQSTLQPEFIWHNWESEGLTPENTAQFLETQPEQLGIVNIPNARVVKALKTIQLLSSDESPSSITQIRTTINSLSPKSGVEPEQLWNMAQQHGYTLAISWSPIDLGCYDVVFSRQSTHDTHKPFGGATPLERKKVQPKNWQSYANNPLKSQESRQLQSQLRGYLSARLPEYMVPTAIVMLDALPLTPNGKVDRKALPAPETNQAYLKEAYVAPQMRVMLLRLTSTEHILLLVMHHIISDGWSMGVFHRELSVIYDAFVTGKISPLPELSIQYADFAVWQRTWLEQTALKKQLQYWEQQLADLAELHLPTDYSRPVEQSYRGAVEILELPKNLKQALVNLSQQYGVTLFMTMLAVFKVLLHRYTGQTDIAIGSPIANRNRSEIEPLIGFFANTLVLRTQIQANLCFDDLLSRVQGITLGAYANQDLPFERLVEVLEPERHLNTNPLFQVVFAVQNAPRSELQLKRLQLSPLEFEDNTTRFDLEWHIWEEPQGLRVTVSYATDLFAQETIKRMLGHFQTLLEGVVANPYHQIWELPLLSATEHQQLLLKWNDTDAEYPQDKCIHQLFEEQVERTPDAVAVVFSDQQLTYRELNAQANQLANYLQALKVESEVVVGICMKRSIKMIVGVLGILKAGGAYLPLDLQVPAEQLRLILRNTKALVVLSQQDLLERLALDETLAICLDTEWEVIAQHSQENPISRLTPLSLIYVTYPLKPGVLVEHQAVSQRLQWLQKSFVLSATDVVLHKAELTQDTAVREIFWPLVVGGRLTIATQQSQNEPTDLQRLIAEQKVSVVNFAPSELSAFVASPKTEFMGRLRNLRLVLCSGEPLQRSVLEAFKAKCTAQLQYLYSLPEVGGELTSFACESSSTQQTVLMGYPSYRAVYVLDQHLQPVPVGVKGEIYVGGTGLARGYFQADEETAQRFVKNPFAENAAARLFKTGELGRYLNDGTLEWLGSSDRQTWIQAYRVELLAVEVALLTFPSVENARVLLRETLTNERQLVAYVVLTGPFFPEQLHSELQSVLPAYQLPHAYVPLSTLPLTKTGAVDELALSTLEVIDTLLVQRWEEQLESLPEIDQVAVVVQEVLQSQPPLHLMDLLADWKAAFSNKSDLQSSILTHPQLSNGTSSSTTLAMSDGGLLPPSVDLPTNLAQALHRAAQQIPTKGIVYIQSDGREVSQSYKELLQEAQRIQAGLTKLGLKPQDIVIFQLEHNQDFIPAFWGCVLGGFVPVPIAVAPSYEQHNSTTSKLENAWQMLERPTVLTSAKLAEAIRCWSEGLNLENFQMATVDELRCYEPEQNMHTSQPEDLAILLLTSGSTGVPKAVMQSHHALLIRSAASAVVNDFTSNDVSLNWFPLDHVGGLVMFHIQDVYVGCQHISAPIQLVLQNPVKWLDWIERYRATITWAPNFAYGLINDRAADITKGSWDLSSMRFILNGGEAIVAKQARNFLQLLATHGLSTTAMHPSWGMSETCSGVVFSKFLLSTTTDEQKFVEVGAPIPGVSLRIVDELGQVVKEETIGRVQIGGAPVTSGYYQNPQTNAEVLTTDGWFNTGDLGFIRKGCLTITGRDKDVIIVNGLNYYSHEIESTVEELDGVEVSYTAAVTVRDTSDSTDKLAIFFSPSVSREADIVQMTQEIRRLVVQNMGVNPEYLVPVDKQAIPKTTIGKIQRAQLKQRFEAGEFNDILKQLDINLGNANTLPDWFYRKIWRTKQAVTYTAHHKTGYCLIFLDSLGLGEFLCRELARLNQPYVTVEAGLKFAQVDRNHYCIDPHQPDHYQHLLESLKANDFPIAKILHLWT